MDSTRDPLRPNREGGNIVVGVREGWALSGLSVPGRVWLNQQSDRFPNQRPHPSATEGQ